MKIDIEEYKAYLNSEKGKEYLERRKKEMQMREKEKKEILTEDEYILWLEQFTTENPSFSDNDWLYFPEDISEEDEKNVSKLSLLYEVIANYANDNYMYPKTFEFGNYYLIKFNNIGYGIGVISGQGTSFSCDRIDIEKEEDFIDFEDIRNGRKHPQTDVISTKLQELANLIDTMIEENVPIKAISEVAEVTIQKVLKKKN